MLTDAPQSTVALRRRFLSLAVALDTADGAGEDPCRVGEV